MIPTPVPVDLPSSLNYPSGVPGLVEHLGWGPVAQGLMGPLVIVEPEVGAQFPAGVDGVGVSFQVHLDTCVIRWNLWRHEAKMGPEWKGNYIFVYTSFRLAPK